jgi:hypothetical protein
MRTICAVVGLGAALATAVLGVSVAPALGQTVTTGIFLDQTFTPLEEWDAPRGYAATLEVGDVVGRMGFHASFRSTREEGPRREVECLPAPCEPTSVQDDFHLRSVGAGVVLRWRPLAAVDVLTGFNVSYLWQRRERRFSGEEATETTRYGRETGLGPSLGLRFPPVYWGARPTLSARYDRVFGGSCVADASCFPDRDTWSFGAGLAWTW